MAPPKGLIARIGSVPLCGDGQAAAGSCDASSQVGTTTVGSGVGATPFFLGGKVFMTGPYKGAPYGMSIVVPARAGPFDLGTVVVRAAVFVDRRTTQLRVVSDPLPSILEGIPLRMRTVNVNINRDKFLINPTNCSKADVAATVGSIGGGGGQRLVEVRRRRLRRSAVQAEDDAESRRQRQADEPASARRSRSRSR